MKPLNSNNSLRQLLCLAFVVSAVAFRASAQTFTYNFSDVSTSTRGSSGGVSEHLTFSSFTAAAALPGNSNVAGVLALNGWDGGATNGSDVFNGTLNTAKYFEFTITPDEGFSYSLTSITFSAGRTSTGPRQFVIRASHDGFAANLPGAANSPVSLLSSGVFQFTDNGSTNLISGQSVILGGDVFSDLTTPITFRIYAFNSESTGYFRMDDVSIYATSAASAVPEPSTYAVACGAIALGAAALLRRRRMRADRLSC